VAAVEAAHARLWGAGELFEEKKNVAETNAETTGEQGAGNAGDTDEDDMDALLRDLPGGIGK